MRGAHEDACFAVVSDDGWNEGYPTLFVVELACREANVPLGRGHRVVDEVPRRVALSDELKTVHETMLVERVGRLSETQMGLIAEAMAEVRLEYEIRGAVRPAFAQQ